MTGTIVDALQDATTALNNATANILALQAQLQTAATQAQTNATTVINNFLARPPRQTFYIDPVGGLDTNDGLTVNTPKQSMDAFLANLGGYGATIILLNDVIIQQRVATYAPVTIYGSQKTANGITDMPRRMSFLGTAINSPSLDGTSYTSGFWLYSSMSLININPVVPDTPSTNTYTAPFASLGASSLSFESSTVSVTSQNAGSLIEADGCRLAVYLGATIEENAQGHVFRGIIAGGNPNTFWQYDSNCAAA